MVQDKTGVLLINLGTPDEPEAGAIRRYLLEFLSDRRVVDLPRWFWLPLLKLIILRVRPPKLVEKYEMIWGRYDGPIRNITRALAERLQQRTPGMTVSYAMTYGQPSLEKVLSSMQHVSRLVLVPLYPQYAGATTGAAQDAMAKALQTQSNRWRITWQQEYHTHPAYIKNVADSIRRSKAWRDGSPKIVFSFHGIPKAQSDRGDPYQSQCQRTAELVAQDLGLTEEAWMVTYQSRFGPAEWLQPYTDETMASLPSAGVKDVLVVCPGFSVDCLETLEEIKILNREIFMDAGGEKFSYVKALNASHAHADMLHAIVTERLADI